MVHTLDAVTSHMARVTAVENKSQKVTSKGNCKNIVLCGDFNSPDIDLLNLLSTTKNRHTTYKTKTTIVDNSTIIGLTTNQPGKIFNLI